VNILDIITNVLPEWLPFLNIISSLMTFILVLYLIKKLPGQRNVLIIVLVLAVVMLSGALFQANLMGLPLWIVLGSGGRILAAALVLIEAGYVFGGRKKDNKRKSLSSKG
jgi:cyanate permease